MTSRTTIRTFVDAAALIAAARGASSAAAEALSILVNPDRVFVVSRFLELEVLPKAVYHKQEAEAAFYRHYFASAVAWADIDAALIEAATREALSAGLSAMDALHVAAAVRTGADEFVTTERRTTLANRVTSVRIRTIGL